MEIKLTTRRGFALGFALLAGCASNGGQPPSDGGGSFAPPVDPGPGAILFAASGELLALTGYAFPPASDNDARFLDGCRSTSRACWSRWTRSPCQPTRT